MKKTEPLLFSLTGYKGKNSTRKLLLWFVVVTLLACQSALAIDFQQEVMSRLVTLKIRNQRFEKEYDNAIFFIRR